MRGGESGLTDEARGAEEEENETNSSSHRFGSLSESWK
jgi:hypothetical protein